MTDKQFIEETLKEFEERFQNIIYDSSKPPMIISRFISQKLEEAMQRKEEEMVMLIQKGVVHISEDDNEGKDEWYTDFYRCRNCKTPYITNEFNYCPKCGRQINWIIKGKEKEEKV